MEAAKGKHVEASSIKEEDPIYDNLSGAIPFEQIYNSPLRTEDPLLDTVSFPEDNLVTHSFTKYHRSEYAANPSEESIDDLEPYVKVCFECFSTDWILLRSMYTSYTKWLPKTSVYALNPPNYSGDNIRSSNFLLDVYGEPQIDERVFEPFTKETAVQNKIERTKDRLELFQYYDPDYDWQPGCEVALCRRIRKTMQPNFNNEQKYKSFRFVIEPTSLTFQMGEVEPFFCSLGLYQLDSPTSEVAKISEEFNFHLNKKKILNLMGEHWDPPECKFNTENRALFSVSRRSDNVYLVLEVSKVLQGSPEVSVEPYGKLFQSTKMKNQEKVIAKIKNETSDYCSRLGKYRQPFAFSILKVFDKKGNLLLHNNSCFQEIYMRNSRDSISTLVQSYHNNTLKDNRKIRDLHGICYINVSKFSEDDFENVLILDPSLQVCKPSNPPADAPLIKEIHEFLQFPTYIPNFFYVNNMYIYILHANISTKNNRNIVVKMQVKDNDQDIDSPSLRCICYPYSNTLVDEIYSNVHYHNKSPYFSKEIKLILPPKLTKKHHLLFTFYHITISKKKKTEELESLLCYAVVPLYPDGRIVVHNMEHGYGTGLISKLEPGYLENNIDESKEILSKAPFSIRFNLNSTIYPEDKSITEFLYVYHSTEEQFSDKKLVNVLKNLQGLTEALAIQYLPVIINNLLEVMVTRENMAQFEAFKTLVIVLHRVKTKLQEKDVPRNGLLELYSNYVFQQTFTTHHSVYEKLCSNFLLYMMDKKCQKPSEQHQDSIFINSWFIFDLVIKSMALKLKDNDLLNNQARVGLFNDVFVRTLFRLVVNLAKYFKDQMPHMSVDDKELDHTHIIIDKPSSEIRFLNKNLALFISDLFSVFDRGIVLDMMNTYIQELYHPEREILSISFQMEFLQVISDNEHFVPLNLSFWKLDDLSLNTLTKRHPLAYIIIYNVLKVLKSPQPKVWDLAVGVLYDNIIKNAFDERYSNIKERERIAQIYFVILPMFIDSWSSFSIWQDSATNSCKREFYICILYLLKSCNRDLIRKFWKEQQVFSKVIFLKLLKDIVITFEYNPKLSRNTRSLLTPEVALFINKVGTDEMANLLRSISNKEKEPQEEDNRLRLLTLEVYTLILDIIEDFILDTFDEISQNMNTTSLMTNIIDVFCSLMNTRPCFKFIHLLYSSLRAFVHKFSNVLFKGDNSYLSQLLKEILLHCNNPDPDVHLEGSALIFILLKLNEKTIGNFGRTKIQTITTLSQMVKENLIEEDIVLQRNFARLSEYALNAYSTLNLRDIHENLENDDKLANSIYSSFTRGIQELGDTLTNILRDTLRVRKLAATADKHTLGDLYYQIAEGYTHTPDLRLVWLENLAFLQQKHENFVESGIIFTHSADLIMDYLVSNGILDKNLIDTNILSKISPNIKEFANAQEGACQSSDFSIKGLIRVTRIAIRCFKSAEYFEFAAQLFKVITPLLEQEDNFHELAQAHTQLQDFWSKLSTNNETRLFGIYFRVGFYGKDFGDELDGAEFVYKEPKLTHILELTDRLKTHFSKLIGKEIGHIDTGKDISKIDSNECVLQITKIHPYHEIISKKFIQNHINLSEFVFETPFTISGKSHADDISKQYKRKTILIVNGSFPCMLTRLPVIKKREIVITPIENAIEDIEKRNIILFNEVHRKPVNPKTLTQVLQGSALPQVNEGALSFCKIFLVRNPDIPEKHVQMLCTSLLKFLDLVREGLLHNKQLSVTDNDKEFHFEMESGFKQLEIEITKYIKKLDAVEGDYTPPPLSSPKSSKSPTNSKSTEPKFEIESELKTKPKPFHKRRSSKKLIRRRSHADNIESSSTSHARKTLASPRNKKDKDEVTPLPDLELFIAKKPKAKSSSRKSVRPVETDPLQ